MTPEQIKQLAKRAGGNIENRYNKANAVEVTTFGLTALAEFARLVREQAFEETAAAAENGFKYAHDGYQIADEIRGLE